MKDRNTSKHLCLCFGLLPILNIYQFRFYNFLHLRFQRVHQPHPAHGVTGFQFLGDACRLHHVGQHGVHPLPRRPVNLQQVRVQLFAQNHAAVKAGPVFLQVASPHTAILAGCCKGRAGVPSGSVAAYGHTCQWGPPAARKVSGRGCSNLRSGCKSICSYSSSFAL